MDFEKWIDGYKVRVFPWIDGKNIYINIQYFAPGSSLSKPPQFDKSALISDNTEGQHFVYDCTSTCVAYIARLLLKPGQMAHITM